MLIDTLDGFLRHGLDHLVFVCGHKGNLPILEQVARIVKERHAIRMATIEPFSWLTAEFLRKAHGVEQAEIGHGSDPIASLAMHLFPAEMRMDLIEEGFPARQAGLPLKGLSAAEFEGFPIHVYCDMVEVAPNGILGDPKLASSETGRLCMERMVAVGTRFVSWFAAQETRCDPVSPQNQRR